MASTSRAWLCLSFCFSFCPLASSLIIPYDGQLGPVLSTNNQSSLTTTPNSLVDDCPPRKNPNVIDGTFIDRL
ncbi:hypothetical protein F4823DRAFT_618920 [Ustulina deusta]|nr:hypothetical protein F4823DRAFT_618920 [Ustulina deusta]